MILRRATKTVQTTPRLARGPGRPRPNPLEAVSPATPAGPLLSDDARVDAQRAAGLRDEHVLEGDLFRLDELDRRPVPRDGLDDLREHRARVPARDVELREAGVHGDRGHGLDARDRPHPRDGPLGEDPLELDHVLPLQRTPPLPP